MSRSAATLALVGLAGCGGGGELPDARGGDAWAACTAGSLELGRCVTDAGDPCTGAGDLPRGFAAIDPDVGLAAIVGPQGSAMYVMAVRTTGIAPGDPDDPASPDNPLVELVLVTSTGAQLARYRGRAGFADDGAAQVAAGLFVVIDGAAPSGQQVRALGTLTDALDTRRCGEAAFLAL